MTLTSTAALGPSLFPGDAHLASSQEQPGFSAGGWGVCDKMSLGSVPKGRQNTWGALDPSLPNEL